MRTTTCKSTTTITLRDTVHCCHGSILTPCSIDTFGGLGDPSKRSHYIDGKRCQTRGERYHAPLGHTLLLASAHYSHCPVGVGVDLPARFVRVRFPRNLLDMAVVYSCLLQYFSKLRCAQFVRLLHDRGFSEGVDCFKKEGGATIQTHGHWSPSFWSPYSYFMPMLVKNWRRFLRLHTVRRFDFREDSILPVSIPR